MPSLTQAETMHALVVQALRDPDLYGAGGGVEVRETHISWVFLAGDRAYKLKKPVVLPFVDYGTRETRRLMCEREIALNRRLAPRIYLGVRGVAATGAGFMLAGPDDPGVVEHVVEMRRFDERDTLAARLRTGGVDAEAVERVGRTIAGFHARAEPIRLTDAERRMRSILADSLDALDGASGVPGLRRFASAYLRGRRTLLHERGALAVDGHADLRAEHVVLEDLVQIVDCVEFDRGLRVRDPASDLAFLAMDIEALGDRAAAAALVDAYRDAGGDPGPPELFAFYGVERALVRAKVDTVRAGQRGGDSRLRARAAAKLALARRLAWRARTGVPLVVCGLSGSGKSVLAAALADVAAARVIGSDPVRKEMAGVAVTDRAPPECYAPGYSRRVYAELGRRARRAVADGALPVVVDATARRAEDRAAFLDALGGDALFAICTAPDPILLERVRRRAARGGAVSDADEAVLREQRFEPVVEVPTRLVCEFWTDRPVDVIANDLEAWVDRLLGAVNPQPELRHPPDDPAGSGS